MGGRRVLQFLLVIGITVSVSLASRIGRSSGDQEDDEDFDFFKLLKEGMDTTLQEINERWDDLREAMNKLKDKVPDFDFKNFEDIPDGYNKTVTQRGQKDGVEVVTNTTITKTPHGVMVKRVHQEAGKDPGQAEVYELLKFHTNPNTISGEEYSGDVDDENKLEKDLDNLLGDIL